MEFALQSGHTIFVLCENFTQIYQFKLNWESSQTVNVKKT